MRYELKHLKVFAAVAEELNFHLAAERLGMTQPAVSRLVSELEDRLNVRLLERTTRMVRLTDPGRYLLAEARDILGRANHAGETVRSIAQGTRAILKIGFTTINGHALVPDVVQHFLERNPEVRIDLSYASAPAQRDRILTGALDGGFMEGSFHSSEVSTRMAARHRLMAIMRDDHPLAAQPVLAVQDLDDARLILGRTEDWPTLRRILTDAFHSMGRILTPYIEAPTLTAILGMVTSGMGLTLFSGVPRFVGGPLVARPVITTPPVLVETHFVWHRANTNAALRRFRDAVQRVALQSQYLDVEEISGMTEREGRSTY